MSAKALKRVILPLIIFPSLTALAGKVLLSRIQHGIGAGLRGECIGPNGSWNLPYTGFPNIDARLCTLVAIFQSTMSEPTGLEFSYHALISGAALFCFPFLEAARSRKSIIIAFPLFWLALCQLFTIAIIFPIYASLFILTGSHLTPKKREDSKITRAHAESFGFSILVGYFVPTMGMLVLNDPQVTAIWQIFPLIMSIACRLHLFIRTPSKFSTSGWPIIQIILMGLFIVSSSLHFATVVPKLGDVQALKTLFVPSLDPLPSSTSLGLLALDFLKWDVIFGYTTFCVLTLWFANNTVQLLELLLWYAFAIPMAGPGAAFTGALLWREAKLQ